MGVCGCGCLNLCMCVSEGAECVSAHVRVRGKLGQGDYVIPGMRR